MLRKDLRGGEYTMTECWSFQVHGERVYEAPQITGDQRRGEELGEARDGGRGGAAERITA